MLNGCTGVPHRRQEQLWSCLPACVRMVLASLGDERSEAEIARQILTTEIGTQFEDLIELERWGYKVRIDAGTFGALEAQTASNTPVIVSVHTSHLPHFPLPPWSPHAVVVLNTTRAAVTIHDPEMLTPSINVRRKNFERAWARRGYRMATIGRS